MRASSAKYGLALALALDGFAGISALACDTDGIDGSEDNAGARVLPDVLARARAKSVDADAMLANNDAYGFFEATGDLVMTGTPAGVGAIRPGERFEGRILSGGEVLVSASWVAR